MIDYYNKAIKNKQKAEMIITLTIWEKERLEKATQSALQMVILR